MIQMKTPGVYIGKKRFFTNSVQWCVVAVMVVLLSACGVRSNSDSTPVGGDSNKVSTDPANDCVETATRNFQTGMAAMAISPIGPFDTSASKGKTFAIIQFAREGNPVEIANANALTEALANVDAKVIIFDGEGRPDVLLQAFESAIAQDVAGIVADGFDMDLVKAGIAAAAAANIPVLDVGASSTTPVQPPGVTAYIAVDAYKVGMLQADYALAQTKCNLHTVTMPVSGASITGNMAQGAVDEVKKLCPDCTIELLEVNPATFITDLAGQVKTTLQRLPDLNYWITTVDFFTPFILQGMEAVDRQLPIVGGAQGDGLADAMKGTNGLVATMLWPPAEIKGYIFADGIMRAVAGVPQNQITPVRLVDSSNWGTSADTNAQFPDIASWQDAFKVAWGVK